jgi:hypothetical protein
MKKYFLLFFSLTILIISVIFYSFNKNSDNTRIKSTLRFAITDKDTSHSELFNKVSYDGSKGFPESIAEIMNRDKYLVPVTKPTIRDIGLEADMDNLPQNPNSPYVSEYPPLSNAEKLKKKENTPQPLNPQTVSTNFTAATLSGTNPTNAFPPDDMGAVGPTQYIVAVNGRIVTFSKTTGLADGVLNTTMDNFFNSVMTPPAANNFTSDPRIRYDRLSQRWFVIIIDVPGQTGSLINRVLIGVSNTSTITASSNFIFFFFNGEPSGFLDYPTLGIDANALYIGGNIFNLTGSFHNTSCYVVRKSSITGAGPLVFTAFRNLGNGTAGPFTPQGVDNYDPAAIEGYIVGSDQYFYGQLDLLRISNPGTSPTLSSDIVIITASTYAPLSVNHLGNTGGTNGNLDALDHRLFAAHYRNGSLWTAQNVRVDNSGVSSSAGTRTAVRWYELQGIPTGQTPTIHQSGTIFDPTLPNDNNQLNYFIPSTMVSGQGHVAVGFSIAGTNVRINSGTAGRLSGDVLNTIQTPVNYTTSSTAYNPPSDPGTRGARRWGDYSYVSLDPQDDMTMWTVDQFCDATNSYGVRVAKLLAPPPATASSANPSTINLGQSSINVIITGTSTAGSGWFDPGTGFAKRITATVSGGVIVNSITYNSPTQVTLNISAVSASGTSFNVTITNPDGQSSTTNGLLQAPLPVDLISFNSNVSGRDVKLNWTTASEINNSGFEILRASSKDTTVWSDEGLVKGNGTTNETKNYTFDDKKLNPGKYMYKLKQMDYNGNFEYHLLTGSVEIALPQKFDLSQNYPNPFNPVTKIDYSIPQPGLVTLKVYDILGKEIITLVNRNQDAGYYTVVLDASSLSSGIYFYSLRAGNSNSTKKLLVVK